MKKGTAAGLAVITGAAGGLGACFANKLAAQGHSLLLIDRREEQLAQQCKSIQERYGVAAEPCVANLCSREEVESLARRLEQTDLALLVNNAGFGTTDFFVDIDVSQHLDMIHLHVLTPVMLTHAVLPGMLERGRGGIINLSSLGAFSPTAGNVQYASTKTYLVVFSEALHEELRGTGVHVQALCPGFVRTEFHAADGMKGLDLNRIPAKMWMSAEDVVECSLRNLGGKRVIVFPGLRNRLLGRLMQMPLFQPFVRRFGASRRQLRRQARRANRAAEVEADGS
jgi:short-subunit dehydrogenase